MREIFIDTGGWVALKHKKDSYWQKAVTLHKTLLESGVHYVTTNFVMDETYTLLLHRAGHHIAVELGEEIRGSRLVSVICISPEPEEKSWQIFKQYSDKKFSFTDCTSFVIMKQRNIWEAFTNDYHFEQAGYQRLLK